MEIYSYAYVNFHSVADAERALDTLNNTEIKGKLVNNTNQIQNQHFFSKEFLTLFFAFDGYLLFDFLIFCFLLFCFL